MTNENKDDLQHKGTLYVVSTPIGNDEDITLRAIRVLKNCDFIVCEDHKVGARLLHKINLSQRMELLNEQNEEMKTIELLKYLEEGKKLCLVSDAGTPLFADPGYQLVKAAISRDIYVSVVPGASSIMTAIVRSGFKIDTFLFAGFLSRRTEERIEQLFSLRNEKRTVVLLETPYRMLPVLKAASDVMPNRKAYIGCNLTMHFESHHYGTFKELYDKFSDRKFKGEFVICFEGSNKEDTSVDKSLTKKLIKRSDRTFTDDDKYDRGNRSKRDYERRKPERRDRDSGSEKPRRSYERRDRDSDSEKPRRSHERRDRDSGSEKSRRSFDDKKQKKFGDKNKSKFKSEARRGLKKDSGRK